MAKRWETMETVIDFLSLGPKITADGDCSHEIKRPLLLWRKVMTNLDSLLKSRDITLLTKVHVVKSYVFSSSHVQMWELDHKEGWVLKNWCFELWCWRRLLRVPWTARRSNQSILKKFNPEYSLEGLMLKLKAILWPLMPKSWFTGKDPDAEQDWEQEEKGVTEDKMVG